jgi:hypothetical protein
MHILYIEKQYEEVSCPVYVLFSEEQQMDLIFFKKNSFKDEECMQLYPLHVMQCYWSKHIFYSSCLQAIKITSIFRDNLTL